MRTYFGFCNLLDLPDFLVRHDIVEPDVWAVPFILLFEGGDDQLGRPVAIMVPTEKPLLPLWCLGSTEQQVYVTSSSVCRHQPHSLGLSPPSSLRKEKKHNGTQIVQYLLCQELPYSHLQALRGK